MNVEMEDGGSVFCDSVLICMLLVNSSDIICSYCIINGLLLHNKWVIIPSTQTKLKGNNKTVV